MLDYAAISSWEAILQCLQSNGNLKLTEDELIAQITGGGFLSDKPRAARDLLHDCVVFNLGKGFLEEKDGKLGRTLKIGQ